VQSSLPPAQPLAKSPSGIQGLDEITRGGLPLGRPTLVCGGPGCGKTLFATEFLVRGATEFGEPGVLMAFEETAGELATNVASLGFDLNGLIADRKLYVDFVRVERSEIEETGDYDLEGLFVRLGYAIDKVGAKRVVLDTIETLFSGFQNTAILRAELRRLFRWLKDRGVTAIITAERGEKSLTREGLEEYVSDCVILLDHRVNSQVSTRRMRIVKYRGSMHGTNEYPFLIEDNGFVVMPITEARLDHDVSEERISTGIAGLDEMLGGLGFYRGSSILLSGTAGTGKTITSAHFVEAACERRERALYFAFEESPAQIVRNVRSVGVDLAPHLASGLLRFSAARPSTFGMETHLARILKEVREFRPDAVVIDPITALLGSAEPDDVSALATRLVDSLKAEGITAVFTSLTGMAVRENLEQTDVGISSVVDSWLLLRDIELNGERNRGIYVLKARGMAHSNQIRELLIGDGGVELVPAYLGAEGVLTGSARVAQQARVNAMEAERQQDVARRRRAFEQRRAEIEAQMAALRAELAAQQSEVERLAEDEEQRRRLSVEAEQQMALSRRAMGATGNGGAVEQEPAGKSAGRTR
jgi:circadian clock protein KaiC